MKKSYLIIGIILLIVGGIIDHLLFLPPEGKIIVKPPIVSGTIFKDKEHAKDTSPLQMSGKMNAAGNMLGVDAWDDEKSVHGDFPISCVPEVRKPILQVSYLFQYHENKFFQSYGISYLHNFGRFAIGPGFVGSNENIGIQGVLQIMF